MAYPEILLQKGDSNEHVKSLKIRLNDLGFGPLDVNNTNFGETTRAKVIAFQKSRLLNPDGEVGPLTWHRLYTDRIAVIQQATTLSEIAVENALTQLYVREKTGKNDGTEVEDYLDDVGLGKGNPWCMAFVYWCFNKAAEKLVADNPLVMTGHVLTQWNKTPAGNKSTTPIKGSIFIMDFGGGKGHTGIVKKVDGKKIITVEGNTSGDPTSAVDDRDGQGVYERMRNISTVKGFIKYS